MTRVRAIPGLDPTTYQRSDLHSENRMWVEKNCYVDVWIELIHSLGLEPRAALPFVLAIDFEGDQWTFFKPSHSDLWDLYGIDVQELNIWRPVIDHLREHIGSGKLISTEVDAYWLPDTQGTDYQTSHTKTTIIIDDLDESNGTLGYFHNAGYHRLGGEDYRRILRSDPDSKGSQLPFYAEIIRIDRLRRHSDDHLRELSLAAARRHFARRPNGNPVALFQQRLQSDIPELKARGLSNFHLWAFANIRQFGAAAELASLYTAWLCTSTDAPLHRASIDLSEASATAKTLMLKLARVAHTGKIPDVAEIFSNLARSWASALEQMEQSI